MSLELKPSIYSILLIFLPFIYLIIIGLLKKTNAEITKYIKLMPAVVISSFILFAILLFLTANEKTFIIDSSFFIIAIVFWSSMLNNKFEIVAKKIFSKETVYKAICTFAFIVIYTIMFKYICFNFLNRKYRLIYCLILFYVITSIIDSILTKKANIFACQRIAYISSLLIYMVVILLGRVDSLLEISTIITIVLTIMSFETLFKEWFNIGGGK